MVRFWSTPRLASWKYHGQALLPTYRYPSKLARGATKSPTGSIGSCRSMRASSTSSSKQCRSSIQVLVLTNLLLLCHNIRTQVECEAVEWLYQNSRILHPEKIWHQSHQRISGYHGENWGIQDLTVIRASNKTGLSTHLRFRKTCWKLANHLANNGKFFCKRQKWNKMTHASDWWAQESHTFKSHHLEESARHIVGR